MEMSLHVGKFCAMKHSLDFWLQLWSWGFTK